VLVMAVLMIPLPKSGDIRGWEETFPLNGPAWSLSYEYLANVLYAVGLRRLSNRALGGLVALAGAALVYKLLFGERGDLIGGWSLDAGGVRVGLIRVMFPFFAGVLLMRLGKRIRTPHAFPVSSLLLVAALAAPRVGGADRLWVNGLYEALCVIVLFPLIVAIGAGSREAEGPSVRIARFFGELSYPLYITHYPLIYIYTGWVADRKPPPLEGAFAGAGVLFAALAIAYAALRMIDEPVRGWLGRRLLSGGRPPKEYGARPAVEV
jgi:peptidoglycan/LPS O-acetylase OafA/YrhL